ncbi:hypothetical protein ACHAXT_001792 [Thalassiosira profunda]
MDDGLNRHVKRQRRAAAAAEGRLPPEVFVAVGAYCCRSSLDALRCTSKQIRIVCSGLPKPWPTNRGCPLVGMVCPDNGDIPEEPEDDDSWYDDYEERPEYKQWLAELQSITPPPSGLIMFHDSPGPSLLTINNEGICIDFEENKKLKPRVLQVWSKEWGLVHEEKKPYATSPALSPPLGDFGRQFMIFPVYWPPRDVGVRIVEMVPQSQEKKQIIQKLSLPNEQHQHPENIKCAGGSDDPCLIFMDRSESAVKMCKISLEGEWLVLTEPVQLVSDPSRTGDLNTRRSSLAVDSRRGIIVFSYDFEDASINIYDMKRNVTVAVPVPEGAGWIRDVEFSPDGKMLVVAHRTFSYRSYLPGNREESTSCAISIYDFDVDCIESMPQRRPKYFRIEDCGYFNKVAFSPKGNMLSFRWHPHGYKTSLFGRDERVGLIDLSPLKECSSGDQISIEVLSEVAQWETFVRS